MTYWIACENYVWRYRVRVVWRGKIMYYIVRSKWAPKNIPPRPNGPRTPAGAAADSIEVKP